MFFNLITRPFYNGLVALLSVMPGHDLGLAVIIFTVLVRLVLFPLAQRALRTQIAMQAMQPELDAIKERYKDDKQKQAERMMALYKEHKVNPFVSFFFLLLQLPIIWGLYRVFLRGGLPVINAAWLYSFVAAPAAISTVFLGLIDVTHKSILLAVIAGATQFLQAQFLKIPSTTSSDKPSFGADLARSMSVQMKYVFPVMVVFISYALPASIALYWATSNLFSVAQEVYLRRRIA